MEVLDDIPKFGKGHVFSFGSKEFIITRKRLFSSSEIIRIPYENIDLIDYYNDSLKVNILSTLKTILLAFAFDGLVGSSIDRNHLKINYSVDGDEAKGAYNSQLTKEQATEMQDLLKQRKSELSFLKEPEANKKNSINY